MFRDRYLPPSAVCTICGDTVTDLGRHLAEKHPVR